MKSDIVERELEFHKKLAIEKTSSIKPIDPGILLRYTENNNWHIYEKEYIFHFLIEYAKTKDKILICEYGCGDGYISCQIASIISNAFIDGIDLSPDLVNVANENAKINGVAARANFIVGDAEQDVLKSDKYDVVLVLNIIHHISLDEAIRQLTRITKAGGNIIILEPIAFSKQLQSLRDITPVKKNTSPDERQLDENEVKCLIRILKNIDIRYFNLFGRLARLTNNDTIINILKNIDYIIMQRLKILRTYAGRILIIGEKGEDDYEK